MGRAEDLFERLTANGEAEIERLIADRSSEGLFLDFKRSGDDGAPDRLHASDRKNLAKAIGGLANSEGGVIVWGVECRPLPEIGDVAQSKHPLVDAPRFVSLLEGAVSGCTVPPHSGVRSAAILQSSRSTGFVATLIPKSVAAPHQTVSPQQFYVRAGSDFVPAPYGVLQGMFGRRPHADVFHMWSIKEFDVRPYDSPSFVTFRLGVMLATHGPGLLRDLFLTAITFPPPPPSEMAFVMEAAGWQGGKGPGNRVSVVSPDAYKLAPGGIVRPISITFKLQPPFTSGLAFELQYGHRDSPTSFVRLEASPTQLNWHCQELIKRERPIDQRMFLEGALGLTETQNDTQPSVAVDK